MTLIYLETRIANTPEVCFDLSRSLDLHQKSMQHTGEKAIAGRTTGLIELGESVTWRARHFGIWFKLTTEITGFDRPHSFADKMSSGPFKSIEHIHRFEQMDGHTMMVDEFKFESPLGLLGRLADKLILKRHMTMLLKRRNATIKEYAESGAWRQLAGS